MPRPSMPSPARLEKAGVSVARGSRALADERRVKDLIVTSDPVGNRLELFHGAETTTEPFKPGRNISGFRTGPLGLGHVVMHTANTDEMVTFYRDLLGFRLTDYYSSPFKATFMHLNPRHHSLAFIETGKNAVHHMMMELYSFDDVGQGYDIAQGENRVATTLGRHTSDYITSFYSWTPSNFMVEYGWGARDIDVANWKAYERKEGPSMWGHDRTWLSKEDQDKARAAPARQCRQGLPPAGAGDGRQLQSHARRLPLVGPDEGAEDRLKPFPPCRLDSTHSEPRHKLAAEEVIAMKAGVASPNGVVIQDVPEPKPKADRPPGQDQGDRAQPRRSRLGQGRHQPRRRGRQADRQRILRRGDRGRRRRARLQEGRPGDVPLARQPRRDRGQRLRPRHENSRRHGLRAGRDPADRAEHAAQRAGHRRPAQGRRERDGAGRKLRRRHHRVADRQADGREVRGRHLDQRCAPRQAQGIRRRSRRQHQGPGLAGAGAQGDRRQGARPHRRHAVRPDREPDHGLHGAAAAASSTSAGSPA